MLHIETKNKKKNENEKAITQRQQLKKKTNGDSRQLAVTDEMVKISKKIFHVINVHSSG